MLFIISFFVAFIAFLYMPTPKLSSELLEWNQNGSFFKFKNFSIFYKVDLAQVKNLQHNRTLFYLHGFPSSSYDLKPILPLFLNGPDPLYQVVISLDFLGFGFSSKPKFYQYSFFEQADIVESLLEFLGHSEIDILAHDYGDTVAQELIHRYNNKYVKAISKIHKVILMNGGIFPSSNFPRWSQKVLLTPIIGDYIGYVFPFKLFEKGFSEVFGKNTQLTKSQMIDYWNLNCWNNGILVLNRILNYINERKINEDRWYSALLNTQLEMQFIYGPADPVNQLHHFVKEFKRKLTHIELHILDHHISHYPQIEAPQLVFNAINNFVKK